MLNAVVVPGLLVVFLVVAYPGTALGRSLRELLVDLPARKLSQVTPGRAALYLGLAGLGLGLFALFEADGARLFMFMAPDLILWITMFDIAVYVDVFIFTATLLAGAKVRTVRTVIWRMVQQVWIRFAGPLSARNRDSKPPRPRASADESDDPNRGSLFLSDQVPSLSNRTTGTAIAG